MTIERARLRRPRSEQGRQLARKIERPPAHWLMLALFDGKLVPREQPVVRRIALTFDDGPDPRWTPEIADTLKRFGVPATFFEIGEHVVENPGLVAQLHKDGFEIGNHTFSHVDLGRAGDLRSLQISLTESAISGAAGIRA